MELDELEENKKLHVAPTVAVRHRMTENKKDLIIPDREGNDPFQKMSVSNNTIAYTVKSY